MTALADVLQMRKVVTLSFAFAKGFARMLENTESVESTHTLLCIPRML